MATRPRSRSPTRTATASSPPSRATSTRANPNCPQGDNTCLFLPPRAFNRFAVTREINDGMLAPRFAPSTRGWVLSGTQVTGFKPFGASVSEDSDDR